MNINEEINNILKNAGVDNDEIIPINVWEDIITKKLNKLFPNMVIKNYNDGEMLINGHENTYPIMIKDYYWHNQQRFMMVNIEGVKRKYKTLGDFIKHLEEDVEYFFVTIGEYISIDKLK